MQFDKGLGQRQAQAGAFIAALQPVIDLAERLQRDLQILRRHADAIVAHRHGNAVGAVLRFQPDRAAAWA